MLHTPPDAGESRREFLFAVGLALIAVAVLYAVASVVSSYSFTPHVSTRAHFELVSRGVVSPYVVAPLLAAVVALWSAPQERARPLLVATLVLGGAVVLLGAWSILDIVSVHVHVPAPNSSDSVSFVLDRGSAAERVSLLLPQLAAVVLAIVTMVGANRLDGISRAAPGPG